MDREYIVTLHKKEDLEQFYNEMKLSNFSLIMKRPTSRNTHYRMTDAQAEQLRQDPRVWDVQLTPEELGMTPQRNSQYVNKEPYTVDGTFTKNEGSPDPTRYQWGHLHCAATSSTQRGQNAFGLFGSSTKTDSVDVFNSGRHVDVVIVDDPVSYDCEEWNSPSTNLSRFVQYQWFNELNTIVNSIDDDNQVEPTGNVTYHTIASNPEFHGNHVCGTACGQHYGWAKEANIYALQILGTMPSGQSLPPLLLFDYLRAFHNNKPINPITGRRNPTVTNHSWGYGFNMDDILEVTSINTSDITSITWDGTTYSSSNPNPSGWTMSGLNTDFGIASNKLRYNSSFTALNADIEDAIEDGVVVIGAAGNENWEMVRPTNSYYNNRIVFRTGTSIYWMRGSSPTCAEGVVSVGAMSRVQDFRRANFTNYGEQITVFAPGEYIVSAYNATGTTDTKYNSPPTDYYNRLNGTSMASPQVAGVAALVASGKDRFTNADFKKYLNDTSVKNEMLFNISGGGYTDGSCQKNSPNLMLRAVETRPSTGMVAPVVGERKSSGLMYPRQQAVAKRSYVQAELANGTYTYATKTWSQQTNYNYQVQISRPTNPSPAPPVAILLHGAGGNGSGQIGGWQGFLPDHILVAPTGYDNKWNIVDESDAPDYEALTELFPWLINQGVNMNNGVSVIGISNGGAMAMRLALEYRFSKLTYVACLISHIHEEQLRNNGVQWEFYRPSDHENTDGTATNKGYNTLYTPYGDPRNIGNTSFNAQGPRAILIINSQNDPVIPYNGGGGPASAVFPNLEITSQRIAAEAWGSTDPIVTVANRTISITGASDLRAASYWAYGAKGESVVHHVTDIVSGHTVTTAMRNTVKSFVEQGGNIATAPLASTYTFTVGNSGASHYTFTGTDSTNTFTNATDPTINCNVGDTLVFNVNAPGHPFYVKTSPTTGTGNQVTTGTISGQGATNGTVTWNTTGVTAGTYYYICQFHGGMVGQIVIS